MNKNAFSTKFCLFVVEFETFQHSYGYQLNERKNTFQLFLFIFIKFVTHRHRRSLNIPLVVSRRYVIGQQEKCSKKQARRKSN